LSASRIATGVRIAEKLGYSLIDAVEESMEMLGRPVSGRKLTPGVIALFGA
jgi:hypothetical protein